MINTISENTKKKSPKYYILLCTIVASITVLAMWSDVNNYYRTMVTAPNPDEPSKNIEVVKFTPNTDLKYILVWTEPTRDPIMNLEVGSKAFRKRNCAHTKCYVSPHQNIFKDIRQFDAIVFHGPDLNVNNLPEVRSPHQKYIFASMESSHYYPVCNKRFNNYFNWTWTYKMNSDEEYGYISIWDDKCVIIGPKKEMHWKKVEEMDPIDDALKKKLSTKRLAAAWFVSNCHTPSKRERVVLQLRAELSKYNLAIDIYGGCGKYKCPRSKTSECLEILERDYYFYLSFENSFSEDYVTEKLLHALQHYTVPIVYGGANYTRFMPDGIYLDARKLSVAQLAEQMAQLINDKEKYYSYFKWHNHYSYHDVISSPESDAYCKLCAMMNDERFDKPSTYEDFVSWWSPPNRCYHRR
ncbi:alpha-(1,3)-fucosyltransferase C-like [Anticarsia gemmatalis]|uniref:alpha-(1,3)-fucosyltransferase C-like n=1 Tax=Anticarsia gemmatalis TaxID=129554 RepID=UPI003F75A55D